MEEKGSSKRKSRRRTAQELLQLGDQLAGALRKCSVPSVHDLLSRGAPANYRAPPSDLTCLEIACSAPKAAEATLLVRALLQAGADPCAGKPALLAADGGNYGAVATLLRHPRGVDFRATLYGGVTLLHHLCSVQCAIGKLPDLLECLRLALDRDDAPVNRPDALGMTPVMHTIEMHFEDRLDTVLRHRKHRVCLDFVLPSTGTTAREVLLKRFPEFRDVLPPPVLEDLDSPDPHSRLLAALQLRRLDVFQRLLVQEGVDPNHWYDEPYSGTCLEAACRLRGSELFVKALLDAGADPKFTGDDGARCSFLAYVVSTCNYETLKVLLESGRVSVADVGSNNVSALHMAVMQQRVSSEDVEDSWRCVQLVLDEQRRARAAGRREPTLSIDHQDALGNTALHYASLYGNRQTALMLLRNGAGLTVRNNDGQMALGVVHPAALKTFLDELIDCNRFSTRNGFDAVIFDYDFIFPRDRPDEVRPEIEPLLCLTDPRKRHLIQHPVIFSFLFLKWFKIRHLFALDILNYFIFMIALNIYIFFSKSPVELHKYLLAYQRCCGNVSDLGYGDPGNLTVPDNSTVPCDVDCGCERKLRTLAAFLLLYICALAVEEVVNVRVLGWKYVTSFTNMSMFAVLILSATLIGANWVGNSIFRHVAAVVTLLSWVQLILLSGRLPILSIQLEMVEKVAKTFFKFMLWYSLVLVSFSLCFHSMFRESDADSFFSDPLMSLVRTVTMFAGEFTLDSLPFDEVPGTSQIVYVVFVLLVATVLLNLLNGLAVHDTQAIRANAVELSSVSLVRLVAGFEQALVNLMTSRVTAMLRVDRLVPDPRVWRGAQRRKVLVFPSEKGAVKFYMDPENSRRFRKCRLPERICKDASDIIVDRESVADLELPRAMFRESSKLLRRIVSTTERNGELLGAVRDRLERLTTRDNT